MWPIGIMQGRLTEPKGRGIQFFPFDNWREEFELARNAGLKEIEFIFDYEDYEKNPIWQGGIQDIKELSDKTGIRIKSLCFDYFMRRPFFKFKGPEKAVVLEENKRVMNQILQNMDRIGIALMEIPLVDASSLTNEQEAEEFRSFLLQLLSMAPGNILFGLETDLPPGKFRDYLDSFGQMRIGANYDSGNSSGIGYMPYEEVTTLKNRIFNIHIKDRMYQGTTVELGTGSADFKELFRALKETGYEGSFILQAARGADGSEQETIKGQVQFLSNWIETLG